MKIINKIGRWWHYRKHNKVRKLFKKYGYQYYGGMGTIHSTRGLDVEVDQQGNVVAVWFRCSMLPFTQFAARGNNYKGLKLPELHGVQLKYPSNYPSDEEPKNN